MIPCNIFWVGAVKNLSHFYKLNLFDNAWNWFFFAIQVDLLIYYSDKNRTIWPWILTLNFKNAQFLMGMTRKSYQVSTNPLSIYIGLWKSVEFHLIHWKIPQVVPYYCSLTQTLKDQRKIKICRSHKEIGHIWIWGSKKWGVPSS